MLFEKSPQVLLSLIKIRKSTLEQIEINERNLSKEITVEEREKYIKEKDMLKQIINMIETHLSNVYISDH